MAKGRTKKNQMQTKVVFRKWSDGSVLALFPEDQADYWGNCGSYEHVGQHGAADYTGCIAKTKAASAEEYKDLKAELESAPFSYQLAVIKRYSKGKGA